jgi:hypothetical protein
VLLISILGCNLIQRRLIKASGSIIILIHYFVCVHMYIAGLSGCTHIAFIKHKRHCLDQVLVSAGQHME